MKNLKKLISIVTMLTVAIISPEYISGQVYNPDLVVIEPFTINVATINSEIGDTSHKPLTEEYGYVILPPSYFKQKKNKSLGMIIVHSHTSGYKAYDLRCAHCFYDYGETYKMKIVGSIPTCPSCGATADCILLHGDGQLEYDFGINSPAYLDAYLVTEKRDKRKIMLHISNTECINRHSF